MHAHARHHSAAEEDASLVRDPVCGMSVDPASAKHSADHGGATYFFCSARCRETFEATPARYLEAGEPEPAPAGAEDAIYTCPMHPEVRQNGPGSCPICGMALEPEMVTRDEGPSEEYLDMRRRFIVGAVLSVPIVIIAMGRHLTPALFEAFSPEVLGAEDLNLRDVPDAWRRNAAMPAQVMRRWAGCGSAVALLFAAVATRADAQDFAFGSAGDPAAATRTTDIVMEDNYFEPEAEVQAGETVRFALANEGELLHQFTLGPLFAH